MAGSNESNEPSKKGNGAEDEAEKGFKVSDRRFWAKEQSESNKTASSGGDETEAPSPTYPSYVEELRATLAEKDKQLREYIAAYKEQIVKGVDETKQRLQRENEREIERLRGQVVEDLLEVLDNLERSLEAAAQSQNFEALVQGVKLVSSQFASKLQALGLSRFNAVGEPFDPALHEAIGTVETQEPQENGRVARELKAGYKLGERVLRPALVQVAKLA